MAIVMVHGFPMTKHLWDPVIEHLGDVEEEIIPLDLPGFAEPPPPGFGCTKEEYVEWLLARVTEVHADSGPVNLVGHDWGGMFALRVASLRPDLLKTIIAGNEPIDEHYPLHNGWRQMAQPGVGEAMMAALDPDAIRTSMHEAMGVPLEVMESTVAFLRPHVRDVGLRLYRSAVDVGREWAPDLPKIVAPSMFIWGQDDMIVPIMFGRRMAARMGAEMVGVPGTHFWQYHSAEAGAAAMKRHWAQFAGYEPPESLKRKSLPY